ncbi:MAG TPA: hypothetical protein VHV51_18575 [Polyangiaceae bacterium]|jgi:hypothetical protein|nr:hypothetical protein [Polyangiaceae bacterium]
MTIWNFLVPIALIAGFGIYYLRIYQKGKAAGGGLGEGFAALQKEKWSDVLAPGEEPKTWGSGVLWRPYWQYWLARQVPILKLVWPMKIYQLMITDRGRLLLATFTALGGLSDKQGHDRARIKLSDVTEEQQGWAARLNPLAPANYKTFEATFHLPSGALKLYAIPSDFVSAFGA